MKEVRGNCPASRGLPHWGPHHPLSFVPGITVFCVLSHILLDLIQVRKQAQRGEETFSRFHSELVGLEPRSVGCTVCLRPLPSSVVCCVALNLPLFPTQTPSCPAQTSIWVRDNPEMAPDRSHRK